MWVVLGWLGCAAPAPQPGPEVDTEAIERFVRDNHDASLRLDALSRAAGERLLDRIEGRADDSEPASAALAASSAAIAEQIRTVEGWDSSALPEAEAYKAALLALLHTRQQIDAGPLARVLNVAEDASMTPEARTTEAVAILGEAEQREQAARNEVDRALQALSDRLAR